MDFSELVSHIPSEWQGLFGALSEQSRPLVAAEAWLGSRYTHAACDWSSLVNHLCMMEPQISEENLIMVPRLLCFPIHLQVDLLSFLHKHKEDISTVDLRHLCDMLQERCDIIKDSWLLHLSNRLHQHVVKRSTGQRASPKEKDTYKFSKTMAPKFQFLCENLKAERNSQPMSVWYNARRKTPQTTGLTGTGNMSVLMSQSPGVVDVDTPQKLVGDLDIILTQASPVKRARLLYSQQDSPIGRLSQSSQSEGLDEKIEEQVLKLKEIWLGSNNPNSQAPEEINIFTQCSPQQMHAICDMLDLNNLSEVAMATSCHHMTTIAADLSYSSGECFARECLLKKVEEMTQNSSRIMQAAVSTFAKHFPQQTITAVLIPAAVAQSMGTAQADLMCKLLKEVYSVHQRAAFISELLASSAKWEEPLVGVVQMLIDMKVELSSVILSSLVVVMEQNSVHLSSNLKFAKLVLAVINKYGKQLTSSDVGSLGHIIDTNKTFLKKATHSALKKVK